MGIERDVLLRLYRDNRWSMSEVAVKLGCSVNKVAYWMDRHGIGRRSWSDATYSKRNRVEPFRVKTRLSPEEERLKALAIGLFLGEGCKRSRFEVRLANSEARVLRPFVAFLRRICGVSEDRLRVGLVIHPDVPVEEAERYWSIALAVPRTRFWKTHVLGRRGRGTYKERCRYGVATVYFGSAKLRRIIDDWISEAQALG